MSKLNVHSRTNMNKHKWTHTNMNKHWQIPAFELKYQHVWMNKNGTVHLCSFLCTNKLSNRVHSCSLCSAVSTLNGHSRMNVNKYKWKRANMTKHQEIDAFELEHEHAQMNKNGSVCIQLPFDVPTSHWITFFMFDAFILDRMCLCVLIPSSTLDKFLCFQNVYSHLFVNVR